MQTSDGVTLSSGEAMREALEHVLARPEFQQRPPSLGDRIAEAIAEAVRSVVRAMRDLTGEHLTGEWSELLVLIVLLVVLAALVGHMVWSVLQLRSAPETRAAGRATAAEVESPGRRGPGLVEAAQLAAAGAFAEAMHALYHGVITALDDRGLVRSERFKTGADYAADLGPQLRPSFRSLLAAYYPVAFGGRRAGAEEWTAMRRAASELGLPA